MSQQSKTLNETCVAYCRVSSKDQEREGFSIPAQLKLLRQYAHEQNLAIMREFTDVETAKQAGRSGFGKMLAFLKADPSCRIILVEKTDRLYRNIKDWVTVDDLDLEVHFVKENVVVSNASRSSDKLMHGIKVLMAKNYVDNLSEEVKKGMREKAEQGHWPSVAPIGYVNDLKNHRIDVDLLRGPLISEIFYLYASGGYSLKALAVHAYSIGLTHARSGRRMMRGEIHRILVNPIYVGEFVWAGKRYQGSHEPLITRETFEQVQAVLRRKPRARYARQRSAIVRIRPDSIIADHKAAEPSQGVGRVLGHFYEAALSCTREVTGANGRTDVDDIIRLLLAFGARLLLAFGADPNQRGINDYTPLHMAVAERNPVAVQTLLDGGSNPELRTRIDECEAPLEMAEAA